MDANDHLQRANEIYRKIRFYQRNHFLSGAGEQVVLAVLGAEAQVHRIYAAKCYKASMGYEQEVTPETTLSAPSFYMEKLRPRREEKFPQGHTLVTEGGKTSPEGS